MASCKFCGKPVLCSTAHHAACWETQVNRVAQVFCDQYCRFPTECPDEDALREHCDACALIRLVNLGL